MQLTAYEVLVGDGIFIYTEHRATFTASTYPGEIRLLVNGSVISLAPFTFDIDVRDEVDMSLLDQRQVFVLVDDKEQRMFCLCPHTLAWVRETFEHALGA